MIRIFIDHRQEQWPEWLGMAEFVYNNKAYLSTQTLSFKANYGQDPRMGFEGRKKEKYVGAKKFANRKRSDINKYKVGDLVMLSTKDLKYQIVGRRTEKLTKRFVGPYKVKKVVSSNAVELELPSTVKIHPVVNVSRIR